MPNNCETLSSQTSSYIMAITCLITYFIVTTFVNMLTIVVMVKNHRVRESIRNIYVTALSAADTLVSFNSLIAIIWLHKDSLYDNKNKVYLCIFFQLYWYATLGFSLVTAFLIAMDRFMFIRYPFFYIRHFTERKAKFFTAIGWLCCVAYSILARILPHDEICNGSCNLNDIMHRSSVTTYVNAGCFFVLITISSAAYLCIWISASKQAAVIQKRQKNLARLAPSSVIGERSTALSSPVTSIRSLRQQPQPFTRELRSNKIHSTNIINSSFPAKRSMDQEKNPNASLHMKGLSELARGDRSMNPRHSASAPSSVVRAEEARDCVPDSVHKKTPKSSLTELVAPPNQQETKMKVKRLRCFASCSSVPGVQKLKCESDDKDKRNDEKSRSLAMSHLCCGVSNPADVREGKETNKMEDASTSLSILSNQIWCYTRASLAKTHSLTVLKHMSLGSSISKSSEFTISTSSESKDYLHVPTFEGRNMKTKKKKKKKKSKVRRHSHCGTLMGKQIEKIGSQKFRAIVRSSSSLRVMSSLLRSARDTMVTRVRIAKRLAWVFLFLLACWLPYIILSLAEHGGQNPYLTGTVGLLVITNSTANFMVYSISDSELRRAILRLFRRSHRQEFASRRRTKNDRPVTSVWRVESEF